MIFIFLFLFCFVFGEKQLGDGVLAVVGAKVVLFSTVLDETNLVAQEQNISIQKNPFLYEKLFKKTLEKNINNKIILSLAEKDSSLVVDYSEIKQVLDERVSYYVSRFGSVLELEKQMGFSVGEMKEKNWKAVEEELMVEKYRVKNFKDVSITKHDVVSFYKQYKDSLPLSPQTASFSVLEKKISLSNKNKTVFLKNLNSLQDSLAKGLLDFTETAIKRSVDPSVKKNKGVLVTLRGDLVPEYEKQAYSLDLGEVSSVVQTQFGYHIIKLLEKTGEKIKSQHILFTPKPTKEDRLVVFSFLDSLKQNYKNDPGAFDSLCVASMFGGSGYYEKKDFSFLPPKGLSFLKNGEDFSFSDVFQTKDAFFLVYKYSFNPSIQKNLENSWFELEEMALNKKRYDVFNLWIKNKKKDFYIKINDI